MTNKKRKSLIKERLKNIKKGNTDAEEAIRRGIDPNSFARDPSEMTEREHEFWLGRKY